MVEEDNSMLVEEHVAEVENTFINDNNNDDNDDDIDDNDGDSIVTPAIDNNDDDVIMEDSEEKIVDMESNVKKKVVKRAVNNARIRNRLLISSGMPKKQRHRLRLHDWRN